MESDLGNSLLAACARAKFSAVDEHRRAAAQSVVSFCIDPQFVSANTTNAAQANAASIFPYIPPATAPGARMFRIGVTNGIPTGTAGSALMSLLHANAVFTLDDDLAFSRP